MHPGYFVCFAGDNVTTICEMDCIGTGQAFHNLLVSVAWLRFWKWLHDICSAGTTGERSSLWGSDEGERQDGAGSDELLHGWVSF